MKRNDLNFSLGVWLAVGGGADAGAGKSLSTSHLGVCLKELFH